MSLKNKIRFHLIEKNANIAAEYGMFSAAHKNGIKRFGALVKLNFHYRVLHKTPPCLSGSAEEKHDFSDAEAFARELAGYDTVSFDVFDTLIFRRVGEPKKVFDEIGGRLGIESFREIRAGAEAEARKKHFKKYGNYECTLGEIYAELEKNTGVNAYEGIKAELEAEYETCFANPFMLEVFEILKRENVKICIVSDMYLPRDVIGKLLEHCGFTGYAELLVSNEHGCGKGGGALFGVLRKRLPEGAEIIHIGDNYGSDVLGARAAGLDAVHYHLP